MILNQTVVKQGGDGSIVVEGSYTPISDGITTFTVDIPGLTRSMICESFFVRADVDTNTDISLMPNTTLFIEGGTKPVPFGKMVQFVDYMGTFNLLDPTNRIYIGFPCFIKYTNASGGYVTSGVASVNKGGYDPSYCTVLHWNSSDVLFASGNSNIFFKSGLTYNYKIRLVEVAES